MAESVKRLAPLFNRVLIRKAEPVTQTKSGFHIPEKTRSDFVTGTVVAVGPGDRDKDGKYVPCCINVGDQVILPDYGGTRVKISDNQEEYSIYRVPDILAKVCD